MSRPSWIEEYTFAFHRGFANMMPCSWGPIDGMAMLASLDGTFLDKLHQAITRVSAHPLSREELRALFPSPSGLRIAISFTITEYAHSHTKNVQAYRETLTWLVQALQTLIPEDTFAAESNRLHTPEEISSMLKSTAWQTADPTRARNLGRLYNSLSASVLALSTDFFPQNIHDVFGPYAASERFGANTILTIKYFPAFGVELQQIYRDVRFRCELIGAHALYEGNVIQNMVAYALLVDGKEENDPTKIATLTAAFAEQAMQDAERLSQMSMDDKKELFLTKLCEPFAGLFPLTKMDANPTPKMREAVREKEINTRYELAAMPDYETYLSDPAFEGYWLREVFAS